MTVPEPLGDDQVARLLERAPGWARDGDVITRTFAHTYHECVHLAVYVAAKAREIGHHPDMRITWQRIRFDITTHDAGGKITTADFELARAIDMIAAAAGAQPVPESRLSRYHRHCAHAFAPHRCPASLGKLERGIVIFRAQIRSCLNNPAHHLDTPPNPSRA